MKTIYLLWLCLIVVFFSHCATIAHGPLQKFVITADPKVASIYIDGRYYGKTPGVIRMKRNRSHLLVLKLDGYQPYELQLKRKLDGWAFGNLATGGIPGIAIDLLSGSIYRLTPKDIYPTLTATSRKGDESVAVLITLTPQNHWEPIGKLQGAH
jgi:hypothetical protein